MSADQLQSIQSAGVFDLGINQRAHSQFAALEPVIINREMITNAIAELTKVEERLAANIEAYVTANGGEEAVDEAVKEGEHSNLPLARFKLELVRTTMARFQTQLEHGEKALEDFVKINIDE